MPLFLDTGDARYYDTAFKAKNLFAGERVIRTSGIRQECRWAIQ